MINVELIYVPEDQQAVHLKLTIEEGLTIKDLIEQSGLLTTHPELALFPTGIFSKLKSRDSLLKNGDRVEFYRPLRIEPKQKRRERAKSLR